MRKLVTILLLGFCPLVNYSQLPDSTLAPNFIYTDLDGVDHELYHYLSEGNFVFLDCFAVWCDPCWNQLPNLHETYADFGPDGDNSIVFLALEIAANTSDDLTHPWGVAGDWGSEIEYPIINETPGFIEDWNTQFTPAFYMVRPDSLSFLVYPPTPENVQIVLDGYIPGCTDELACNYVPTATHEDWSCDFSCYGCMDDLACNFNSEATLEDNCDYISCAGCTNSLAENYDAEAQLDDGACIFDEDLNTDHVVNMVDLSILLSEIASTGTTADFNGNGQVDSFDLLHFLIYVGIIY